MRACVCARVQGLLRARQRCCMIDSMSLREREVKSLPLPPLSHSLLSLVKGAFHQNERFERINHQCHVIVKDKVAHHSLCVHVVGVHLLLLSKYDIYNKSIQLTMMMSSRSHYYGCIWSVCLLFLLLLLLNGRCSSGAASFAAHSIIKTIHSSTCD